MKKSLLLLIAALMSAWSATTAQPLPDKNWNPAEGSVAYSATDVINIHIAGTSDNQYDRLEVTGTLTPGGATLNIFPCYTPTPGDRFIIFKAPTIDTEFSNPPLIDAGGNFFVLSYEKENGDDIVVLTAVAKLFGLGINTIGAEPLTPYYSYTLNVLAEPTEGGTVAPTQTTFSVCDVINIEATANEGYHFSHWTQEGGAIIDDTEASATTATMPARDVTITANFCEEPNAPVATAATGVSTNTFTANWEAVTGIVTYTLDVALDDEFTKFVPGYENYEVVGTFSQTVSVFCTATYFYRVKATDECGTSDYSATVSVTVTATLNDIDGNVYNTVLIGNQCWMAENLKTTQYSDGSSIDYPGTNSTEWAGNTTGAYAWHNNDIGWKDSYGGLYNWYAANNANGLCPTGWRVPSRADFNVLSNHLGGSGVAGGKLKSTRTLPDSHPRWNSPNKEATNDSNWSGFPGGYRHVYGSAFEHFGGAGYWWTYDTQPYRRRLSQYYGNFLENYMGKPNGYSIRCLKD